MKRLPLLRALGILALLLAACQPSPAAPGPAPAADIPTPQTGGDAAGEPQGTAPAEAARSATLETLEGEVNWRAGEADTWQPAQLGQALAVGEQLSTGADGRAAVRFSEGTLTRVSPNSAMTLTGMSADASEPTTEFKLDSGGLFVILNGGSAEVETNAGVASVRGSYLNVRVTPQGRTIAACLEGQCSLATNAGEVALTNGQRSRASSADEAPEDPQDMDAYEYNLWFEEDDDALRLALDLGLVDEEDFGEDCDFESGQGCELDDGCDDEGGCDFDDEDDQGDDNGDDGDSGDDSGGDDSGDDDSGSDDGGGSGSGDDEEEEEEDDNSGSGGG
ncbi:MAG: FecR domain-containing protein [Chloroflexi bacterium]|nr:FecR domain-containing protein [Chloroflexota bacterium]